MIQLIGFLAALAFASDVTSKQPVVEPVLSECICPVGRRALMINPDGLDCELEGYELLEETTMIDCPDGSTQQCGGPGWICQNEHGDTMETIDKPLPIVEVAPGGWSIYEGDLSSKWNEVLSNGVISVEGISAEDLTSLGHPTKASSQVVAGTNYKFGFSDGTEITVLEQVWMDPQMQITRMEKPAPKSLPVQICESSPQQWCKMLCPKQQFCPEPNQCALRIGHCCNFTCVNPNDVKAELGSCFLE